MAVAIMPLAAATALLVLAAYRLLIHPAVMSPLARIPNAHWSSAISPLWILFHRQQQRDTATVDACHRRLGPIIRVGPNDICVNSVDGGVRPVYGGGGFEKGEWYDVFANYGVASMFAMRARAPHGQRKRMLGPVYAKSALQNSAALASITDMVVNRRLRPALHRSAAAGEPVELYDVFSAVAMDAVTAYIFGRRNGSNFLRDRAAGVRLFRDFKRRQKYAFWPQELPRVTAWLARLRVKWLVVPTWVDAANARLESWLLGLCEKAEETCRQIQAGEDVAAEDTPTVYAALRRTLRQEPQRVSSSSPPAATCPPAEPASDPLLASIRPHLASELLDHTFAGFDTSGITLTWLAWQLSRPANRAWQDRLRAEIASLHPSSSSLDAQTLDRLPILHAIVMESLRLHAAIPGQQPRMTPSTPRLATLGDPHAGPVVPHIPPGVRVQAQAYSLHREPAVFPDPDTWDPSRWLLGDTPADRERLGAMSRWFWAFGSGARMCVGRHLAMLQMKAAVVGVWRSFRTHILDDAGMLANGGYLAEPVGVVAPGGTAEGIDGPGHRRSFLVVRLRELDDDDDDDGGDGT